MILTSSSTTAVANNGTLTFPYPSGKTASEFVLGASRLYVEAIGAKLLEADDDFDVTLGVSNVTVTYKHATPIPAGTRALLDLALEEDTSDGIYVSPTGERCIGSNRAPNVDLVINDVNGDGYIECRLEGGSNAFFANYYQVSSGYGYIELWQPTGSANIDISPKPFDGSSLAQVSIFRNSTTTGRSDLTVYKGDGTNTVNAVISGKGDSYVNLQTAGEFGVGTATPAAKLHVHTAESTEKARFTRADETLGLSLGYDEASSTNVYIFNRYGSGASAIHLGTGTDFSANRLLTLERGGKATLFGLLQMPAGTTSRAQINLPVSVAPSAPVDGDIWREDNTNTGLKVRINGVTKTITVS